MGQDWAGGGCRRGGPSWGCPRPWCGGGNSAGAPGGWRWWRDAWGAGTPVWGCENKESGSESPPHGATSCTEATQRTSLPVAMGGGEGVFLQRNLSRSPCQTNRRARLPGPLGRALFTPSDQSQPPSSQTKGPEPSGPRAQPHDSHLPPTPKSHRRWVEEETPQLGVGPRVLRPEDGSGRGRAGGCSRRALGGAWGGLGSTLGLGLS